MKADTLPPADQIIATARLVLRPRVPDDADALYATMSNPALMTWWSRSPFTSVAELREDFARTGWGTWRCWAITQADDDAAIGFVAAGEKRQGGVYEIGYLLDHDHWGRGIAQEAVTAMIDRLFAEGNRRVFADVDPDNAPSIALLERLGFVREGVLRAEWDTHIGIRDSLILGLLASEWRGRNQEGATTISSPAPARASSA